MRRSIEALDVQIGSASDAIAKSNELLGRLKRDKF
jgi:hypothetical protein